MEREVIAALLVVGLLVGCGVGSAYARARRGWADYRTARNTVPGARRAAFGLIRAVTTKVGVIALLLVGAVAYAAGSDDDRAGPAPGPSATPTATHGARAGR
ncbi:hypothetical protein [Micromonospora haikouensis]|uniref:hypothetical protein n=1 Tax=Micromonospora haikouensis TaxID=686309 RepID=UPI003D7201EE